MREEEYGVGPTKVELTEAYAEWLARYEWDWFVTLKFNGNPSRHRADKLFRAWVSEIELSNQHPIRWARVAERGAFGDHLHFHVLVGGLRKKLYNPWKRRWLELGRGIDLREYSPDLKGIFYILKSADPEADFDIDMHLPPLP
jgi:hypothetical protein